jgi:hypothetical protein
MPTFSDTGSYSGHLRLRIQVDVGDVGSSTSSVNVRLRVWVGTDGWDINDEQHVGYSGWKSGGKDFQNNLSSGEVEVIDESWSHSVGGSSVSHSFSASLSGNSATGTSPSVNVDWRVEGKPGSTPGIPRSLSVGQITAHGAHFDWSPPLNNGGLLVRSYDLQFRRQDDSDWDEITSDVTNATINSSLDRNTIYKWRVKAVNSAGSGDFNDGDNFRTHVEHPVVGLPVEVDTITATSAHITWAIADNGGSGTDSSRLIVSTSSTFDNQAARVSDSTSTVTQSRTVTGLTRATKYYYWIQVFNGTFWSDWTQVRDFTTDPTAPVERPTLTVGVNGPTAADMTWSWSGDNGGRAVTGYDYQVSTVSDFSSLFASGNSYSGTSKTITGLTAATQYYFRVRAENSVGNGSWSAVRSLVAPQGVKCWNGTSWVAVPLYHWDGTDWAVPTSIKGRDGSGWVVAS